MGENNRANGVKQAAIKQIKECQMQKHQANQTTCTLLPWRSLSRMVPHHRYMCHRILVTEHIPTLLRLCSVRDVALDPNNKKRS